MGWAAASVPTWECPGRPTTSRDAEGQGGVGPDRVPYHGAGLSEPVRHPSGAGRSMTTLRTCCARCATRRHQRGRPHGRGSDPWGTMARVFPNLFATHRVRAVDDYASHLLRALRNSAATNEADPTVVVLTPGGLIAECGGNVSSEHGVAAASVPTWECPGRPTTSRDAEGQGGVGPDRVPYPRGQNHDRGVGLVGGRRVAQRAQQVRSVVIDRPAPDGWRTGSERPAPWRGSNTVPRAGWASKTASTAARIRPWSTREFAIRRRCARQARCPRAWEADQR